MGRSDDTTTSLSRDQNSMGPDEGGVMGENTPFAGGWDRQPSEDGVEIDASRGHADSSGAGPNSDATALVDDPQSSSDNRA